MISRARAYVCKGRKRVRLNFAFSKHTRGRVAGNHIDFAILGGCRIAVLWVAVDLTQMLSVSDMPAC